MAAPVGYDIGLKHASVNGGVSVGFLLDSGADEPLVEERAVVAQVDVTTAGVVSVASYGLGATIFRLRLALCGDVLKRDHQTTTQTPITLRTLLLAFAAQTDGLTVLHLHSGDRLVAFVEQVRFLSGPSIDGYVARVVLADLGTA